MRPVACQAKPAHAGATKATEVASEVRLASKAPQKRAPRLPAGASAKRAAKDDRSDALAVLAKAGVPADDPRIAEFGWSYLTTADDLEDMRAAEARVHREFRAVARAIEGVDVATRYGRRLKQGLRALCDLYTDEQEPTIGELEGLLRELSNLRIKDEWKPRERAQSAARSGRPADRSIEIATYNAHLMHGWTWRVCAAALFIFSEDFNQTASANVRATRHLARIRRQIARRPAAPPWLARSRRAGTRAH